MSEEGSSNFNLELNVNLKKYNFEN